MKKLIHVLTIIIASLIFLICLTSFASFAKINDAAAQNDTATTNLTATAPLSTNGAGVKVNIKTDYKTQIPIGTVKKLKITNQSGKVKVKSSDSKIIRITKNNNLKAKKPGKATITIKTNGITIKRKVKAVAKLKIVYNPKQNVKLKVGIKKKITEFYTYTTNLTTLKKHTSATKYKTLKVAKEKKVNNPKATSYNSNVVACNSKSVVPKDKGTAKISIKCGKQKPFIVNAIINKPLKTKYKGYKTRIVYSAKEVYEACVDAYMNYEFKGIRTPDEKKYLFCSFAYNITEEKLRDKLYEIAKNDHDNALRYSFVHNYGVAFEAYKQNGDLAQDGDKGPFYLDITTCTDDELKIYKKTYDAAKSILDSINIDSFTDDYEKVIALRYWFKRNCDYKLSKYIGETLGNERSIIINHVGVCSDYASATNYFYHIMGIPSIKTDLLAAGMHNWNIVKLGDKWYHIDNLNYMTLFGNKDLYELGDRSSSFKMSKQYFDVWEKRVSDDSIMIYQSKLKEIAEKCGIITDSTGKYKMWVLFGGDNNIICDLE